MDKFSTGENMNRRLGVLIDDLIARQFIRNLILRSEIFRPVSKASRLFLMIYISVMYTSKQIDGNNIPVDQSRISKKPQTLCGKSNF